MLTRAKRTKKGGGGGEKTRSRIIKRKNKRRSAQNDENKAEIQSNYPIINRARVAALYSVYFTPPVRNIHADEHPVKELSTL